MRRLEFAGDGSAKFWEAERNGAVVTLHWGRIDTNGQTQHKEFTDSGKAEAFLTKQIAEKQRKGYAPVAETGTTSPAEPPRSAPAPVEPDGAVPGPGEDTFVLSAGVARQTYPRRDIDPPKSGVKRDAQQKGGRVSRDAPSPAGGDSRQ
jgi:predicted DNA-binding WGR domain protein